MSYQSILDQIHDEITPTLPRGELASYIPQLADVDPCRFGMAVVDVDGHCDYVGDARERFSIQSISKVFALSLAMQINNDRLWQRVGREPSGTAFNSLVQLEYEEGVPRNPFINSGALVVTDLLISELGDAHLALLDFVHQLSDTDDIDYDLAVAASEMATGYRNAAMANFLKSFNNLDNHPDTVLDVYCHHCALSMNCIELAHASTYLARLGSHDSGTIIRPYHAKYINSMMLTCGTYDAAGEFAYRIGLPCKSGVGGGIVAVLPGVYSLCVWAPGLGPQGNSLAGAQALQRFTELTGETIF